MQGLIKFIATAIAAIFLIGTALADTENVKFPKGYGEKFVRYHAIDKPSKRFGPTHRIFFINKIGLNAVKAGKPLPNGTVIIREDWHVKNDGKKNAIKGANGKYIVTEKKGALVMEKEARAGARPIQRACAMAIGNTPSSKRVENAISRQPRASRAALAAICARKRTTSSFR